MIFLDLVITKKGIKDTSRVQFMFRKKNDGLEYSPAPVDKITGISVLWMIQHGDITTLEPTLDDSDKMSPCTNISLS